MKEAIIPVVLFAYARPKHLARTLACLRENRVPLIYAFADGAKGSADASAVRESRAILSDVDWCEVRIMGRSENVGLGRNILAGVTEVAENHDAFIVWEDDLICVPGTYSWMSAGLQQYANDHKVMSITAWTHPRVTPPQLDGQPYLDGRAECWVWGTWKRAWKGMVEENALQKLAKCESRGLASNAYGDDLPIMAKSEQIQNIWAVRWLYHHLQHGGLCLRPPWSMVEHIGFDAAATNAAAANSWANPEFENCARHPFTVAGTFGASALPRAMAGYSRQLLAQSLVAIAREAHVDLTFPVLTAIAKAIFPRSIRRGARRLFRPAIYSGDYRSWAEAREASGGYDNQTIFEKTIQAARAVRDGHAAWERDSQLFSKPECHLPLLNSLRRAAGSNSGRLNVLDFGGAFGSTWWQHRSWLSDLAEIRWNVVEQPLYVEVGMREFTVGSLRFFCSLEECVNTEAPTVALLSSVLPYLEKPHELLAKIAEFNFPNIIVDRTGFVGRGRDRLTVQNVPMSIYQGSYPCWFFDRTKLLNPFAHDWRIVDEWEAFGEVDIDADYRGFMLERNADREGRRP